LHRPAEPAVPRARRAPVRLRAMSASLAVVALLAASAGAAPASADDPAATGGAAIASAEETLREGDRGPAVRRLQRRLGVTADGAFGPRTDRAVRRFQRRRGLVADGIVGPLTRDALGLARFASADVVHDGVDTGDGDVRLPRVLVAIGQCESGGNPRALSANGRYRGKYQFSRSTWKAVGGRGSDPARASEAHQDRMALRLYRAQGAAPWPACGAAAKRA
jgi:peptidoglycan hydrolase-like protein with peptidoglycan-binding domain